MENLYSLIAKASNQVGVVILKYDPYAPCGAVWYLSKDGSGDEDLKTGLYMDVVLKLKEWATPPKPKTVTVTVEVPFKDAVDITSCAVYQLSINSFRNALKEAIKPWVKS